jgi:hypothetical protein
VNPVRPSQASSRLCRPIMRVRRGVNRPSVRLLPCASPAAARAGTALCARSWLRTSLSASGLFITPGLRVIERHHAVACHSCAGICAGSPPLRLSAAHTATRTEPLCRVRDVVTTSLLAAFMHSRRTCANRGRLGVRQAAAYVSGTVFNRYCLRRPKLLVKTCSSERERLKNDDGE